CIILRPMNIQQILREPLPSYIKVREAEGIPLKWMAQRALKQATTCGDPAHGTAKLVCAGCGYQREITFSCKCVTLCTRCGIRRAHERSQHLMAILSRFPVRHWVVDLPPHLRFNIGYHHKVFQGLLRRCVNALT